MLKVLIISGVALIISVVAFIVAKPILSDAPSFKKDKDKPVIDKPVIPMYEVQEGHDKG